MKLREIQKILREKANKKTKQNIEKFVPSATKIYGVKNSLLNEIIKKIKELNFELIKKLWESGYLEERILAAKILGKFGRKEPEKSLQLVKKWSGSISNWAVCDILATQGIRGIVRIKMEEVFKFSERLIKSKNFWKRRFAIVLLIELNRNKFSKAKIRKLLKEVKEDKKYYVKKAIDWLKNELNK